MLPKQSVHVVWQFYVEPLIRRHWAWYTQRHTVCSVHAYGGEQLVHASSRRIPPCLIIICCRMSCITYYGYLDDFIGRNVFLLETKDSDSAIRLGKCFGLPIRPPNLLLHVICPWFYLHCYVVYIKAVLLNSLIMAIHTYRVYSTGPTSSSKSPVRYCW